MRLGFSLSFGLLAAVLSGCGDGGTTGSGGAGAAGGSGGSGGSGAGPCAGNLVEVVGYGEPAVPMAGTTVLVNDAAGAVVSTATSDTEGKVCVDVPAGGSVGALFNGFDSPELSFVVAPPPGALVRLHAYTEAKTEKKTS